MHWNCAATPWWSPRPGGTRTGGKFGWLLAEKYPHLIAAAAAISPAIWTSYAQATAANPGAYASAAAAQQPPSLAFLARHLAS